MMDLVLEHMQQQAIHTLVLHAGPTVDGNDPTEVSRTQPDHHVEQLPVYLGLRQAEFVHSATRLGLCPGRRSERAPFHRVDVEPVDYEDVVQRCA